MKTQYFASMHNLKEEDIILFLGNKGYQLDEDKLTPEMKELIEKTLRTGLSTASNKNKLLMAYSRNLVGTKKLGEQSLNELVLQVRIHEKISERKTGPPAFFATTLGITTPKLMHILTSLKEQGVPIVYCKYRSSYEYLQEVSLVSGFQLWYLGGHLIPKLTCVSNRCPPF